MEAAACELTTRKCKPCEGGVPRLSEDEITSLLGDLKDWAYRDGALVKAFAFRNYHETTAFVNATAWVSHREDHHPDLIVGYNRCEVRYWTHAIDGLSENDFICAAKIDALFAL
jgi:4a-hydroxytetrahydrobiopterin dehydratase